MDLFRIPLPSSTALLFGMAMVVDPATAQPPPPPPPDIQAPTAPPLEPATAAPRAKPKTEEVDTGPLPFFPVRPAWRVDLGAVPSAPPAFDAERGYVPLQTGRLAAVTLDDGSLAWTEAAATRLEPAADTGRVFVAGDGELAALAAATGKTLWRTPLPSRIVKRPTARGGWVVVSLESGDIVALRAEDGKTMWTAAFGAVPTIDPTIEGDRIYAAFEERGMLALDVLTGKPRWERRLEGRASATTRSHDVLYVGTTGRWFYAVDEGSGRVRWRWRVAGEPIGVVADDQIVVTLMLDHTIRAFKVGNGAQAWREALLYRPFAGPVRAPRQLLVAGYGATIRAYRAVDGTNAGLYALPAPSADAPEQLDALGAIPHVRVGPSLFDDLLVVVTQRGTMHGARRQLMPAITPLTAMPGTLLTAPKAPRVPAGATPPGSQPPAA